MTSSIHSLPGTLRREALNAAAACLLCQDVHALPYDPFAIIACTEGWHLFSYADFNRQAMEHTVTAEAIARDAFSLPVRWQGQLNYVIVYNERIRSSDRIRFSLCHEIGHIMMGHHRSRDASGALCEGETPEETQQADLFASAVLAPPPLMLRLRQPDRFRAVVGMSPAAFDRAVSDASLNCAMMDKQLVQAELKAFAGFMYRVRCLRCGHVWLDRSQERRLCPVCRSPRVQWSGQDETPPRAVAFPWVASQWRVSRAELEASLTLNPH